MFNFLNIFKQKLNLNKYSDDFFYGPSISEGEIEPLFKKILKRLYAMFPIQKYQKNINFIILRKNVINSV